LAVSTCAAGEVWTASELPALSVEKYLIFSPSWRTGFELEL
jgi:hypothetical protein